LTNQLTPLAARLIERYAGRMIIIENRRHSGRLTLAPVDEGQRIEPS
jgi:hypothetical protein